ncbi:hypothetical protein CYY_000494 [Polysphondylium violaceum]|uniref:DUF6748 domain-containing protein n=1 Tax=Polysphondylium violaceum TaxID=133409 RepID=A0A8J4Q4Q2_9MYCE|nr:hypothetical protein CYY_000494 [Polysphondylium violaceum]
MIFKLIVIVSCLIAICLGDAEFGLKTPFFYTIKRDLRKCAAPMCGGYYLSKVNTIQDDIYVYAIQGDKLDDNALDQYIVGGKVTKDSNGFQKLTITDTNRLAPLDATPSPSNVVAKPTYYRYSADGVVELNENQKHQVTNYTETYTTTIRWLQTEWFTNRIVSGSAVLAGRISNSVLKIDKVFLHVPDQLDECPQQPIVDCIQGYLPAFKRDANRCKLTDGCARPSKFCPTLAIVCNQGYSIVRLFSKTGCYKFYCDPSFLL